jgi:hypothetical protein
MKFDEARKAMASHLATNEFKDREDAKTTLPAIKVLQEINKAGFLTTNSQTGEDSSGFNPDTKNYYHIRERAYLDGYMKKEKAIKFIDYINTNTDKIAYFVYGNPDPAFEKLYFGPDKNAVPSIPVTIAGISKKSVADIKSFSPETEMPTTLPQSTFDFYKKYAKINKSEDVHWVSLIDPVYGRHALKKDGLFIVVLEALKK